jgi:hypothetical protein
MTHHVEVFWAADHCWWGWECLTCGAEAEGFGYRDEAEYAGDDHITDSGDDR